MTAKISILLAAYNSEKLLQKVFVPSFKKNCSVDVELIVCDNGGNGEYLKLLAGQDPKVKVVGSGENLGLNVGLNECSKVATGDYFYLLHTDMHIMPNWDVALLEACKNLPPASFILSSRSIEPTKGHTEYHIIKDYGKEWNEFKEEDLLRDFTNYKDNGIVGGCRMPVFLHRKLWDRMSDLNEKLIGRREGCDPQLFSFATDNDLIITAHFAGVRRFWMVNNSLVYHLQGKSNNQQKVDKDSNKPYDYYRNKWRKFGYDTSLQIDAIEQKLFPWYVSVR